jgi:hypothetical protein
MVSLQPCTLKPNATVATLASQGTQPRPLTPLLSAQYPSIPTLRQLTWQQRTMPQSPFIQSPKAPSLQSLRSGAHRQAGRQNLGPAFKTLHKPYTKPGTHQLRGSIIRPSSQGLDQPPGLRQAGHQAAHCYRAAGQAKDSSWSHLFMSHGLDIAAAAEPRIIILVAT